VEHGEGEDDRSSRRAPVIGPARDVVNDVPRAGALAEPPVASRPSVDAAAAVRAAFRNVFPGVVLAMFLAAVDQTILASALPAIAGTYGGIADISWVAVGYLLAAAVAAPIYGHLGDRFGRRRMLLVALAVFTLASAGCAAAPSFWLLVAARGVQGLGGGGLMTLAQALIGEAVPPRERGRFQGYFAAVFAASSAGGPVIGALLTEYFGWRSLFLINLPLGLLAALLALRIPAHATPAREPFKPDFVGTMLFAGATLAMLFAISSAGHRLGWSSPWLWGLAAGACAGFVALVRWERGVADPVIPVRVLARPAILRSDFVVVAFAAALLGSVLYLPLYLQLGRGIGVGASGLLLLPMTLASVAGSTLTGRMISRTGRTRAFPIGGLALATVAFLALAATVHVASTAFVLGWIVLAGFGLGCVMPAIQLTVQAAAGREALGRATASISLSRAVGGALGTAAVGTVLAASIGHADGMVAEVLSHVAEQGPAQLALLSADQQAHLAAQLADAFRFAFLLVAGITAAGAVLAARVPVQRLPSTWETVPHEPGA
jgi:EmrB/QacA subfamily drug resistance transporter